jgi:hypothetical protein
MIGLSLRNRSEYFKDRLASDLSPTLFFSKPVRLKTSATDVCSFVKESPIVRIFLHGSAAVERMKPGAAIINIGSVTGLLGS